MVDSILRTVVTYIVALLLGWAAKIGLGLDSNAVFVIITAIIGFVYYAAARFIEQKWPGLGRLLISFGLSRKEPVYVRPGATVVQGQAEHVAEEHWPQPGQM